MTCCCSPRPRSAVPSSPGGRPNGRGAVLEAACSWYELEVETIDATPPRSRIDARMVHRGRGREFIGFNRAKHAVLEAAILATRVHMLPPAQIKEELDRLEVLVEKTAGPREREAWELLRQLRGGAALAGRKG